MAIKRRKKKCPTEKRGRPESVIVLPNTRWSMDFVSDSTASGQRFRILTVIDEATRESLALEVDTSYWPESRGNLESNCILQRTAQRNTH